MIVWQRSLGYTFVVFTLLPAHIGWPSRSSISNRLTEPILSSSVSAIARRYGLWGIFGTPADTPSNLTFTLSPCQSTGQIDWHAWSTFRSLANTCPRILVCWFLRQHMYLGQLLGSAISEHAHGQVETIAVAAAFCFFEKWTTAAALGKLLEILDIY